MIVLRSFCGNGTHIWEAWRDHGLTHCFLDTVTSSILFGFIFLFGGAQILIYWKYSTVLERRWLPKSCLYQLQILLCILMSVESVVHFSLRATVIGAKTVYVYNIMSMCMMTVAWPLSVSVICLERKRLLPSIPTRGHGLVLLIFWSLAFITENLAFLSWFSDDWWWHNREYDHILFCVRFLALLQLFLMKHSNITSFWFSDPASNKYRYFAVNQRKSSLVCGSFGTASLEVSLSWDSWLLASPKITGAAETERMTWR